MTVLNVPVFGGGVVLEGSSDAQRTDELAACDGYDIGARGQLAVASDLSDLANVSDGTGTLTRTFGLAIGGTKQSPQLVLVGKGPAAQYTISTVSPDGGSVTSNSFTHAVLTNEVLASFASFPYVDASGVQTRAVLVNLGARETDNPNTAPGLYVVRFVGGSYTIDAINKFDYLGTGVKGEKTGGTHGSQAYPRWIVAYNNHVFLGGYDARDATNGDGANRLAFCNIGNPLKYGLDPAEADPTLLGTDRTFTDSDAFTIGGAGEILRGGYVWNGKLFVGTNTELHYVEGFGRASFLTNASVPIRRSKNIVGLNALVEGPDALLYGVGSEGLWAFNGADVDPIGNRLRNFAHKSPGWWDLIWTDPSAGAGWPGYTNRDFVWMIARKELMQVWVVIPFCNAGAGYGNGSDTVIIKYHVLTGGFTRQVITGEILTKGVMYDADATFGKQLVVACTPSGGATLRRYGYQATPAASPMLPGTLPDVTFGEYAPFGPDGVGVMRKRYITIAWEPASSTLGLVFTLTPTIDGQAMTAVTLTISATAPGTPANGDLWVDTSGTDTNLGNGTAGVIVPANAADYILKRYVTSWSGWRNVPGGGQQGNRVSLPIAFDARVGTRCKVRMQCLAADRRYQIEGFGEKPALVRDGL